MVSHEGVVRRVGSIAAPTKYELYDPSTDVNINYLYTTSPNLDLSRYDNMRIIVTGEEGLDARWKDTPLINIQSIQVISTNAVPRRHHCAHPDSHNVIDGRAIAAQIQRELAQRVAELNQRGVRPGLAFVRVGEDPASKVYVGRKEKPARNWGFFPKPTSCPKPPPKANCSRC